MAEARRSGDGGRGGRMSPWTDREKGPECYCGGGTFVSCGKHAPILICIFHTWEAGASFCLPKERPEKWPNLTHEEMQELTERGIQEQKAEEAQAHG